MSTSKPRHNSSYVFVVGCPRSGTSLLGDILHIHPLVCRWYEPYFVTEYFFRASPHDCRSASDASQQVKQYIRQEFDRYRQKRGCEIIVDKSPRNSMKLPFFNEIFPNAKYIHIIRDGRDAALSLDKMWQNRQKISKREESTVKNLKKYVAYILRQPFWQDRWRMASFEMGGPLNVLLRKQPILHRTRWEGRIGCGPRFEGWQAAIDNVSSLEFSAMQWSACVNAIVCKSTCLDHHQLLEVRYEELLQHPEETLRSVFEFLGLTLDQALLSRLPIINSNNHSKWQTAYSAKQKAQLGPILQPMLKKFQYVNDVSWYEVEGPAQ